MEEQKKTQKGIAIRRRCDCCGTRIDVLTDMGSFCLLKCGQCGKEYKFYVKT